MKLTSIVTPQTVEISRFKVNNKQVSLEKDLVVTEEPLKIDLIHKNNLYPFTITLRTPGNDRELITGALFTEGIISKASDIISLNRITNSDKPNSPIKTNIYQVTLDDNLNLNLAGSARQLASYSSCGFCGKTQLESLELISKRPLKPAPKTISCGLIKQLKSKLAQQQLFTTTGGSHVAGLIYETEEGLSIKDSPFFEDVGRHNALDKLIGHELIENDLKQQGILLLSGRIGFELVQKAVMAGFSMIVALGAPSNLAVDTAKQFDIALIGFAKDNSFNLYTGDTQLLKIS